MKLSQVLSVVPIVLIPEAIYVGTSNYGDSLYYRDDIGYYYSTSKGVVPYSEYRNYLIKSNKV